MNDCKKLSGGLLTGDDVVGFRIYSLKVTPLRSVVIGSVALFQDEPLSVDLTIFPPDPTATKELFPKVTPLSWLEELVALFQVEPLSVDLTILEPPTATNVLFPKVTPLRLYELDAGRPEFALFQFEPLFVDLTIFPDRPTATKVESVLEETILFPKVTPLR